MELFKTLAGVEAAHVPYKGSAAQATADLLAGRVAMGFVNTSTTLPYVRSGQLRAIAVAEKARLATAPDIRTLDEAGFARLRSDGRGSALAPAPAPLWKSFAS